MAFELNDDKRPQRFERRRIVRPENIIPASTEWTFESVKIALLLHEMGDLSWSGRLAESMGRDAEIRGSLGKRVRSLTSRSGLPFSVVPSDDGDQRRAKTIADRVRARWWDVVPESSLAQMDRDTILLGMCVGYLDRRPVEIDGQIEWWPVLVALPAHGLRYIEDENRWQYASRDGLLDINPGDGFWFLHTPNGPRSFMDGAIRALAFLYLFGTFTERDWARWCEKHGMPVLAIEEPFFAEDDVGKADAAAYYAQFQDLGSETVLRLPSQRDQPGNGGEAWGAKWLELKGRAFECFEAFGEYVKLGKRLVLTGRDSDTSKGGDGEAATERVSAEYLAADAEPLSTSLRAQVWAVWGPLNVANWSQNLTPWGRWDTRPPPDLAKRATTLKTLGEAVEKLQAQGADVGPLFEEFNVKRVVSPKPAEPEPTDTEPPADEEPDAEEPAEAA